MAARALLQRGAVAPLTASLLAGGIALFPRMAHAEAPADHSSRKPIYDDFSDSTTLTGSTLSDTPLTSSHSSPSLTSIPLAPTTQGDTPPRSRGPTPTDRLASRIRVARLFLYRQASRAEDALNAGMDRAFHLERNFTSSLASLAPPRDSGERLMPGLIYVLVAAMAGSIATRRSGFVLRAAAPVALGAGAAWVVLPITMRNVGDAAWRIEQRFPAVAEAHQSVYDGVERGVHFARVHTEAGVRYVDEKVGQAREAAEGWVRKGK